jgi:hypothetical protein
LRNLLLDRARINSDGVILIVPFGDIKKLIALPRDMSAFLIGGSAPLFVTGAGSPDHRQRRKSVSHLDCSSHAVNCSIAYPDVSVRDNTEVFVALNCDTHVHTMADRKNIRQGVACIFRFC